MINEVSGKKQLSREELKNVIGGRSVQYLCSATSSCCGTVTYSTDSQSSASAWYSFYASAGDNPSCVASPVYEA